MTKHHDIVPVHLVVQAMRDNGYKNAAYALAELIDIVISNKYETLFMHNKHE